MKILDLEFDLSAIEESGKKLSSVRLLILIQAGYSFDLNQIQIGRRWRTIQTQKMRERDSQNQDQYFP